MVNNNLMKTMPEQKLQEELVKKIQSKIDTEFYEGLGVTEEQKEKMIKAEVNLKSVESLSNFFRGKFIFEVREEFKDKKDRKFLEWLEHTGIKESTAYDYMSWFSATLKFPEYATDIPNVRAKLAYTAFGGKNIEKYVTLAEKVAKCEIETLAEYKEEKIIADENFLLEKLRVKHKGDEKKIEEELKKKEEKERIKEEEKNKKKIENEKIKNAHITTDAKIITTRKSIGTDLIYNTLNNKKGKLSKKDAVDLLETLINDLELAFKVE